jgi:two-component system cell cycle sensor histidine kinase/response regulator CckA
MRALVLTDETNARAIDDALRPHGYQVERADCPAQVEAQARRGWALIILDWDALGAAAPELCRALVDGSGATLLALARDGAAALPAAVAAGADDALELPRDEARLVARALAAARMVKGRAHDAFVRLPLPSWIFDEQSLAILAVNDATLRAYGWTREELSTMSLYDLRPPEERARLAALVEGGKPTAPNQPWVHWRKDGSRIDVEVLSAPLNFGGRRARIAVARDVSEHVRQVEDNRQSLADYRAFVERMPDGCVTYRPDGIIAYVNQALLDFLGYRTPDALIGRHCLHMIHPDDHELVAGRMRQLTGTHEPTSPSAVRFVTGDGQVRWGETRGIHVLFDGGPAVTVLVRDLTERRRTEEALRLSEERFSKIFHANAAWITITRLSDDSFVDINERFVALSGFGREELLGHTGVELGMWPQPMARKQLDRAVRSGRMVRDVEVSLRNKAGQPLEVLMSLEAFSVGGEECVFCIGHDVTERRQLEQQLRHAQKMEAIGRLAGGVAHDFNNLLTAIRGYAQILMEQLPKGGSLHGAASHIERSAGRAAGLTAQLLAATRRQPQQPRVVDLNDVVRAMNELLQRIIGEDIALQLRPEPALSRVRVDPSQMEQVLLNLAVNARDAMERGGRLVIETANVGDRVRLRVRDFGCGMTEETRLRVFEPFFTTKEVGKGSGLGLSIVYGVVTQNGGTIVVDSAPGQGTTFDIFLPAVHAEADQTETVAQPAPPPRGIETILLVEDDEDVRDFVQYVLRQAGYAVLTAPDGPHAIDVARSYQGEIHLVLSDVIMPHMNGLNLVSHLQPLRPKMKVLHMSGYPGDSIARQGELPAGVAFLQKPFSADQLTGTVRALLDAR